MNIRPGFTRVGSIAELGALRDRYLDELPFAQDGLVEALVADGTCFRIDAKGRPAIPSVKLCASSRRARGKNEEGYEKRVLLAWSSGSGGRRE